MSREILIFFFIIFAVLTQYSLIASLGVNWVMPNLVFIVVFFLPFLTDRFLFFAFLTGLFLDFFASPFIGFYILIFLIVVLIIKKSFQFFEKEKVFYFLGILFFSLIFYNLLENTAMSFIKSYPFGFRYIVGEAVFTFFLTIPLFFLLKKFNCLK